MRSARLLRPGSPPPRILLDVAFCVLLAASTPGICRAYSSGCHENATQQGALLFTFPELESMQDVVDGGTMTEDYVDHIYGYSSFTMTLCHFWDADEGDLGTIPFGGYDYQNGWVKSRELLALAVASYNAYIAGGAGADKVSAYEYLGHVAHIVEDQAMPAHAHVDYHPNWPLDDDSYEDWTANADGPEPCICPRWTAEDAHDRWGAVIISPETEMNITAYLAGECWEPRPLYSKLYYLLYTGNQIADYFASDSYDGDIDDRLALVDFSGMPPDAPTESGELSDNDSDPDNDAHGHLSMIAGDCYTYAISATGVLYRAWRDYWDDVDPSTQMQVTLHPEVRDGWRAGNVQVRLTGYDDSDGEAVHDSGVHKVEWQLPGEDWDEQIGTFILFSFADEGISEILYRSTDEFGNREVERSATIKIDKTSPVVTIVSPAADGLYLSDESLTIDFGASDVPSGVYSLSADLDGTPVTDGQVLQDLTHMAGTHTLTVTAEDFAGNITIRSATFDIHVHANVEIDPNVLNTRSSGTISARVGFPPEYEASLIDAAASYLVVAGDSIPAAGISNHPGGMGHDGLPEMVLQFERETVGSLLAATDATVEFVVAGALTDGTCYYGADSVRVSSPGGVQGGGRGPGASNASDAVEWKLSVEPNVISSSAVVEFTAPCESAVSLKIYGVHGDLIRSLYDGSAAKGVHRIAWDGRNAGGSRLAGGVYFVKLEAGEATIIRKILRLR